MYCGINLISGANNTSFPRAANERRHPVRFRQPHIGRHRVHPSRRDCALSGRKIDVCCGGRVSLIDAMAEKQKDSAPLVAKLEALAETGGSSDEPQDVDG